MASSLRVLFVCCALLMFLPLASSILQLWSKVKEFFQEKQPLPKEGEFMRENEFEFPGTNRKLIQALSMLWESYYNCLRTSYANIGPYRSIMPEAIMVFEGSSVKLHSKACISPAYDPLEAVWLYKSYQKAAAQPVVLGENVLVSPEDKSLLLYNMHATQSGQFICKTGQTVTASYFLHVADHTEPTMMVYTDKARTNKTKSRPPDEIPQLGLKVFSWWQPWTRCSSCGVTGKRIRTGTCTVSLSVNHSRNPTTDILQLFPSGVPCRSPILPSPVAILPVLQERPSEIMTGYCKIPCDGPTVYEVRDHEGQLVERANNSAGIFSIFQGVPTQPPDVQRRSQYESTSTPTITIQCPGNINSDAPILWQVGSRHINPMVILEQTRGRIHIDHFSRIIIKSPQVKDSNIYSCWQSKELAGTVKLIVEQKLEMTNHRVTLVGLVVILGTFAYLLYKVVTGRSRYK